MDAQLAELLTNYGDVAGIWFDGMWDKPDADWQLQRTYSLIHKLQPAALIGSNHHHAPFDGEDFQMFEKDLPGANTAGFNQTSISHLPLETCETINGAWGYNKSDKNFKSVPELIHYLVRAAGSNANFLLNIGPMPTGQVQPEFIERLHAIGEWTAKNGETIYGTRGGVISPRSWGVSTRERRQDLYSYSRLERRVPGASGRPGCETGPPLPLEDATGTENPRRRLASASPDKCARLHRHHRRAGVTRRPVRTARIKQ